LRAIVGSVYAAHHQYEVACLNWQSIIDGGHKLLSKADFRQFKALCDNDYFPCRGEYYLYKEWAAVIMTKPKYIDIIFGMITDKDEQARDNKDNHFENGLDNNCRQAFFLVHHQLLAYHHWLSFC
jgi:hypothetical protein